MMQVSLKPSYSIDQKVFYLVSGNQTDYALEATITGYSQEGDRFIYSIRINGGFTVYPVSETDLIVGIPIATSIQHSNN